MDGGRIIVRDAPLDLCPIYVGVGAIIPNYQEINFVGEREIDVLILDIYPGNGSYEHFEDDKESYNYKNSEYNLYRFTQNVDDGVSIKIDMSHQNYPGSYKYFKILFHSQHVRNIPLNGSSISFEDTGSLTEFVIPAKEGIIK